MIGQAGVSIRRRFAHTAEAVRLFPAVHPPPGVCEATGSLVTPDASCTLYTFTFRYCNLKQKRSLLLLNNYFFNILS